MRAPAAPLSELQVPRLIIVSGAPGTGKTTLARLLARELGLPLLAKDDVKEALLGVLDPSDRETSRRIGEAAFAVLFQVAGALLDAGVGAVLESNFRRGISEDGLRPLVGRARAALLHCRAPGMLAMARYRERFVRGQRHRGHFDSAVLEGASPEDWERWGLLDLSIPTLTVDTRDGYEPPIREVVSFISSS